MPLKPLGKPPYLLPDEIENDDLLEIVDKPYIVPAEKTKWGKERGKAQVKILRNDMVRTWSLNNSTWDRLIQDFGEDPEQWVHKKVKVKKELRNISGVDKEVMFGRPYQEPQQKLEPPVPEATPKPSSLKVKNDLLEKISQLSPEYKAQLLQILLNEETP